MLVGKDKTLHPQLVTGFSRKALRTCLKDYYVPRFWIINNKEEFTEMLNYISNIDMIVHPDIKTFPSIYELTDAKGPVLTEVSEIYFKECVEASKNFLNEALEEYNKAFKKYE